MLSYTALGEFEGLQRLSDNYKIHEVAATFRLRYRRQHFAG